MGKTFDSIDGKFGFVEEDLFGEVLVDASGNMVGEVVETGFGKEVVALDGTPLGIAEEDGNDHYSVY